MRACLLLGFFVVCVAPCMWLFFSLVAAVAGWPVAVWSFFCGLLGALVIDDRIHDRWG